MSVLKPVFYDDFYCIADACSYTCCGGWKIAIDETTAKTYQEMPEVWSGCEGKEQVKIRLSEDGMCPFLDEQGLCKLVIKYGPDILSETCAKFPRARYISVGMEEHYLSNACPAVLQLLKDTLPPLSFVMEGYPENNWELQCRNQMIDLAQIEDFCLWIRLYVIYQFARRIEKDEDAAKIVIQYNSVEYLLAVRENIEDISIDKEIQLIKINDLFSCVNAKIRGKLGYIWYVKPMLQMKLKLDVLVGEWELFNQCLQKENGFFENLFVNYIYNNILLWRDCYGITYKQGVEILLIEYSMVRYTLFLWWANHEHTYTHEDLYGIICYYARIMEHSPSTALDFVKQLEDMGELNGGNILFYIQ